MTASWVDRLAADQAVADAHWHRQRTLAAVAVAVAVVVLALFFWALLRSQHAPAAAIRLAGPDGQGRRVVEVFSPAADAFRWMTAAAGFAVVAVSVVLSAVVVHTIRVATFTFRRSQD